MSTRAAWRSPGEQAPRCTSSASAAPTSSTEAAGNPEAAAALGAVAPIALGDIQNGAPRGPLRLVAEPAMAATGPPGDGDDERVEVERGTEDVQPIVVEYDVRERERVRVR